MNQVNNESKCTVYYNTPIVSQETSALKYFHMTSKISDSQKRLKEH